MGHLLFVEDDAKLRELLSVQFIKNGFKLTLATNKDEFEDILCSNLKCDLIILDRLIGPIDT